MGCRHFSISENIVNVKETSPFFPVYMPIAGRQASVLSKWLRGEPRLGQRRVEERERESEKEGGRERVSGRESRGDRDTQRGYN